MRGLEWHWPNEKSRDLALATTQLCNKAKRIETTTKTKNDMETVVCLFFRYFREMKCTSQRFEIGDSWTARKKSESKF